MAVLVVDLLEAVNVKQHQRMDTALGQGGFHHGAQAVVKAFAVQDLGQRIKLRIVQGPAEFVGQAADFEPASGHLADQHTRALAHDTGVFNHSADQGLDAAGGLLAKGQRQVTQLFAIGASPRSCPLGTSLHIGHQRLQLQADVLHRLCCRLGNAVFIQSSQHVVADLGGGCLHLRQGLVEPGVVSRHKLVPDCKIDWVKTVVVAPQMPQDQARELGALRLGLLVSCRSGLHAPAAPWFGPSRAF